MVKSTTTKNTQKRKPCIYSKPYHSIYKLYLKNQPNICYIGMTQQSITRRLSLHRGAFRQCFTYGHVKYPKSKSHLLFQLARETDDEVVAIELERIIKTDESIQTKQHKQAENKWINHIRSISNIQCVNKNISHI